MFICLYICINMWVCICIYSYTQAHSHAHYIYTCVCICMYIYVYIFKYRYTRIYIQIMSVLTYINIYRVSPIRSYTRTFFRRDASPAGRLPPFQTLGSIRCRSSSPPYDLCPAKKKNKHSCTCLIYIYIYIYLCRSISIKRPDQLIVGPIVRLTIYVLKINKYPLMHI